jgi:hypothetical protein
MTGENYKWKARLNVHGGRQEKGVNYWENICPSGRLAHYSRLRHLLTERLAYKTGRRFASKTILKRGLLQPSPPRSSIEIEREHHLTNPFITGGSLVNSTSSRNLQGQT